MSFIVILDVDNSLLYRQKVNDCFFTLMAGFKGLWTAVTIFAEGCDILLDPVPGVDKGVQHQ